MPTAVLQSFTKKANGTIKETSVTKTIVHNNRRLFYDTDGTTYEYVANDASGNRIYRNAKKVGG